MVLAFLQTVLLKVPLTHRICSTSQVLKFQILVSIVFQIKKNIKEENWQYLTFSNFLLVNELTAQTEVLQLWNNRCLPLVVAANVAGPSAFCSSSSRSLWPLHRVWRQQQGQLQRSNPFSPHNPHMFHHCPKTEHLTQLNYE